MPSYCITILILIDTLIHLMEYVCLILLIHTLVHMCCLCGTTATYYGHSEVDIAMTQLFGSLDGEFYNGYYAELPQQPGYEQRKIIYNTYHMLNHYVLFGGGYWNSATSMMDKVLRMT